MGNAAGIDSVHVEDAQRQFAELERKCKTGYFYEHHDEYVHVLRQAITHNLLDHLEVLLVSGNITKAHAVHMAAKMGKIDCLELLISAGFPGNSKDKEERTPLHLACSSNSSDATLCVSMLLINFPATVRAFDRDGNTPVHIAVLAENIPVLQIMKDQNIQINSILDLNGRKPLDVARTFKKQKVIDFLKGKVSTPSYSNENNNRTSNSEVSQERIMAVWEKFFENAFLQAEMPGMNDSFYEENYPSSPTKSAKNNTSSKKHESKGSRKAKGNDYASYRASFLALEEEDNRYMAESKSSRYSPDSAKTSSSKLVVTNLSVDHIIYWLSKLVIIHEPDVSYVVLDKASQIQQWMQSFLDELYYAQCPYWFLSATYDDVLVWPLPETMENLVHCGWISFYNRIDNVCLWMNLVTGQQEHYLPLLVGESQEWIEYYGLQCYYSDDGSLSSWVQADQTASLSWIMVIMEEPEDSKAETAVTDYYLNTMTGDTAWEVPSTWNYLTSLWGGWYLCCMESNPSQTFWFDPTSGQSLWVEE